MPRIGPLGASEDKEPAEGYEFVADRWPKHGRAIPMREDEFIHRAKY